MSSYKGGDFMLWVLALVFFYEEFFFSPTKEKFCTSEPLDHYL